MTAAPLGEMLARWATAAGVAQRLLPRSDRLEASLGADPRRPPADVHALCSWEERHGARFPRALREWLLLSDGFYGDGPLIHPLTAIGPMIPFARVPELMIQPESWFELGNPGPETVCIDLAYRWPGGSCPIFASGDDCIGSSPRIIAGGFATWFLRLLRAGGKPYWHDPRFMPLGDPWLEHRRRTPIPPLEDRLARLAPAVLPLMQPGVDERAIAAELGISRFDLEAIFRHLQHAPAALRQA